MNKYLIIPLIALFSCSSPSNCEEFYFSEEYKDYVYASSDSYWVYTDSQLNITDSVYLISQKISFDDRCTPSNRPHDVLIDTLFSSYFEGDDNHKWIGRGHGEANDYLGAYVSGYYFPHGTKLDSMLVQGIWYKDILSFDVNNDKYYRAKGIGLIKKEFILPNSNTRYNFELTRYHLND